MRLIPGQVDINSITKVIEENGNRFAAVNNVSAVIRRGLRNVGPSVAAPQSTLNPKIGVWRKQETEIKKEERKEMSDPDFLEGA